MQKVFNKTLINVLCYILAVALMVAAVIFLVVAIFAGNVFGDMTYGAMSGLRGAASGFMFFVSGELYIIFGYVILGVLYRLNNK